MTPIQFADAMRVIAHDPDEISMLRRAIAHCMDALEKAGYSDGVRLLHDRLAPALKPLPVYGRPYVDGAL